MIFLISIYFVMFQNAAKRVRKTKKIFMFMNRKTIFSNMIAVIILMCFRFIDLLKGVLK